MKALTDSRGLTLVEVVVAFTILLFGTLAVTSMQRSAERANDDAMALQRATAMAEELLEGARGLGYDDPASTARAVSRHLRRVFWILPTHRRRPSP